MRESSKFVAAAVAIVILAGTTSAGAQRSEDWRICNGDAYEPAIAACTRLIDTGSLSNEQRSVIFFIRGTAYLNAGDNDRAILDFSSAIDANPTYVLAYANRGTAHQNKGELDAAIADATKAIELAPQFAVGYANRSWAHQLRGEFDEAINDATKAIDINPRFGQAYINRAVAYRNKGFRERAIADYAAGTRLDAGNGAALRAYGFLQFDGGDFEGASSTLARAARLQDDKYTTLYLFLSQARSGQQDAIANLRTASDRWASKEWPRSVVDLYLGSKSADAVLNATANSDQACEAQFYVGLSYVLKGDWKEAAGKLKNATEICPRDFTEYQSAVAELLRTSRKLAEFAGSKDHIEYASDIAGSAFEWLEREQRLAEGGSCHPIGMNELRRIVASLPKRDVLGDDVSGLFRSVGLDRMVLPTRCEDVAGFFITNLRAEAVRDVITRVYAKPAPKISWGTLPKMSVNAFSQSLGADYLVVLHRSLFAFAYSMYLVVDRTIRIESAGGRISFGFEEADFKRALQESPEVLSNFVELVVAFRKGYGLPDIKFANNDEVGFVSRQLAAVENFIVGHEFGHVLEGHLTRGAPAGVEPLSNVAARRPTLGFGWTHELVADEVGERLAEEGRGPSDASNPLFRAIAAYAPALLFELFDVLEDAELCDGSGIGSARSVSEEQQSEISRDAERDLRQKVDANVSDAAAAALGCRQGEHPPAWVRGRLSMTRTDAVFLSLPAPPSAEVRFAKALILNARRLATLAAPEIKRRLAN